MKIRCKDCNNYADGIPKEYNNFLEDLCFGCFQGRVGMKKCPKCNKEDYPNYCSKCGIYYDLYKAQTKKSEKK